MSSRSLAECRRLIYARVDEIRAAGRRGKIVDVSFVLCEDAKTVMAYVDLDDEDDAVAFWFDTKQGGTFNPQRYRAEFFRPLVVGAAYE